MSIIAKAELILPTLYFKLA